MKGVASKLPGKVSIKAGSMRGHTTRRGKTKLLRIVLASYLTHQKAVLKISLMEARALTGSAPGGCMYVIIMITPRADSVWSLTMCWITSKV